MNHGERPRINIKPETLFRTLFTTKIQFHWPRTMFKTQVNMYLGLTGVNSIILSLQKSLKLAIFERGPLMPETKS